MFSECGDYNCSRHDLHSWMLAAVVGEDELPMLLLSMFESWGSGSL